jgi:two-component system cell cycle sensor histidine kinase PleC
MAEKNARIETEMANRLRSEFLSNMSHELRTPLNTIIGFSKLLGEQSRSELPRGDVAEFAQLINAAANHLLAIINDILDVSKIQSGRYTIEDQEIDTEELIVDVVASFKMQASDAAITMVVELDDPPPVARGDAVKLRQVLTNLVSNAIKFTPSGGHVWVRSRRAGDGGAVLEVQDTGIGMSEGDIEVALTPFGQVDGSHTRLREGTGLGLTIAKSLIELHGGRLEIASTKSVGTTVRAVLPPADQVSLSEARDKLSRRRIGL